ncbi:hypothetical protein [Asanoa iriomotensis]|uniref:Uncharacterized protein n=1 Tax=Asanoa iriomotensis TaxID=234613 RepID=A0ABQ4C1U7_9ACTN|nr:hypothetical protein [Asanoa iriomotensis]GIF56729.1 hypothetical protein Air01nite_28240 [Asanoa iriomotensis]
MTALPRGATGFWDAADGPPARTDVRAFRQAVHMAAREVAGRVEGFEPAGVTPNFHLTVIRTVDDRIGVVCHALLPWLAIARPPDGSVEPLTFRSEPALAAALGSVPPFRVFDPVTLATPLARLDLSTLDRGEREEIGRWKPGELVFNWWD